MVDRVCGPDAGAGDLLQRTPDVLWVGFALSEFGLHAQTRQRCLELVGGVCQKTALCAQRSGQPGQQVVDRIHQRRDLLRYVALLNGTEVVGLSGADALFKVGQRLNAAHQRQPHQQHSQRQDDELRHHHALDDFGRQRRALALGLCHLHQHQPVAAGSGQPHIGHAHRVAAHHIVAQQHFAGLGCDVVAGQRQVVLSGNQAFAGIDQLVINQIGVIGAQQITRLRRQVKPDLPALCGHVLAQCLQVKRQRAVKRFGGDVLRHKPGQRQTQRPQQQQWREHPVQDFTKQAALFALKKTQ